MTQTKRILVFVLVLVLCIGLMVPAMAADAGTQYEKTAGYVAKTVASPGFGSIGGDWAVLGLARGGADVKSGYFERYYERLESYVKSCEGVLHKRKYTEYSRVALAVTAIGKDARDVAGYDLPCRSSSARSREPRLLRASTPTSASPWAHACKGACSPEASRAFSFWT